VNPDRVAAVHDPALVANHTPDQGRDQRNGMRNLGQGNDRYLKNMVEANLVVKVVAKLLKQRQRAEAEVRATAEVAAEALDHVRLVGDKFYGQVYTSLHPSSVHSYFHFVY